MSRPPTIPAALRARLRGAPAGGWPAGGAIVKAPARGRQPTKLRGSMNKTEARFADRLELLRIEGRVIAWWYEALKFRLADGAWYTPDFLVLYREAGEVELVDVKGTRQEEASRVRIKVAAAAYPCFTWTIAAFHPKRPGGWVYEHIEGRPPGSLTTLHEELPDHDLPPR